MAELMDLGFGAGATTYREKVPAPARCPKSAGGRGAAADRRTRCRRRRGQDHPRLGRDDALAAAKAAAGRNRGLAAAVPAEAPVVPDAVAVAIAESVEGALGEALAAPAPEGTLEAQVEQLAAVGSTPNAGRGAAPAAPEGTLEARPSRWPRHRPRR
jgi:hypothetical protein